MKLLVTGGAGFIGSAVVRHILEQTDDTAIVLDKLTYAANPAFQALWGSHPRCGFEQADIGDAAAVQAILARHRPDAVLHLAAESHVDRSIEGPGAFVQSNIVGTYVLLDATLAHWRGLAPAARDAFRFHHVSTDEVFGSLGPTGLFTEETRYDPRSPYSASKAASDHLARAWHETYGLPVIVTNCSNNYGPYQFPEKLIPLMIIRALAGESLPVYGRGDNVRDWLYVDDHAAALNLVLRRGRVGETYNIGGRSERTNLAVVRAVCALLDELAPASRHCPHDRLISFVADRPGHDARYAIDCAKIERDLGWTPRESFESGLARTVRWYLDNADWWQPIRAERYAGQRLGLDRASALPRDG